MAVGLFKTLGFSSKKEIQSEAQDLYPEGIYIIELTDAKALKSKKEHEMALLEFKPRIQILRTEKGLVFEGADGNSTVASFCAIGLWLPKEERYVVSSKALQTYMDIAMALTGIETTAELDVEYPLPVEAEFDDDDRSFLNPESFMNGMIKMITSRMLSLTCKAVINQFEYNNETRNGILRFSAVSDAENDMYIKSIAAVETSVTDSDEDDDPFNVDF